MTWQFEYFSTGSTIGERQVQSVETRRVNLARLPLASDSSPHASAMAEIFTLPESRVGPTQEQRPKLSHHPPLLATL
jgi:hypothetical protein